MKKNTKIVLSSISAFFLVLVTLMYVPRGLRSGIKRDGYSDVLTKAQMSGDTKVTDIAMLGAHDAFSSKINLASKVDPAEDGIMTSRLVSSLFKGGVVRVTRAQTVTATTLLKRGVRYFDVRVSHVDGAWYTKHALLDAPFENYIAEIYRFLRSAPSEFIVFDIQHIYLGDQTINDFLTYFESLTLSDSGHNLNSFLHYTSAISLADLEYFDVRGTTTGGIIILLNDDGTATGRQKGMFYHRGNGEDMTSGAIRSKWHNQTKLKTMIPLIEEEANYLSSLADTPFFRVNQAQLTPDYLSDPLGTLLGWSLIDIAAQSNKNLLKHPNFTDWLSIMPIFMVDFANSNAGSFNTKINETIITYNIQFSS